jgi:lysophospholipase L1-like esterase
MVFVDCLAMFCTEETSDIPGAIHGGRAMPDIKYFHEDGLHLSEEGYTVWKRMMDGIINEILTKEEDPRS